MVIRRGRAAVRLVVLTTTALVALTGAVTDRTSTPALACGPFLDFAVFTSATAPELPSFVQGQLGIIQPSYARRYLLAAWRTLTRRALTREEQQAYIPQTRSTPRVDSVQGWLEARNGVPGAPPLADAPRQNAFLSGQDYYVYILNCSNSAFDTAAATLKDRRTRFGDGPILQEWLKGQDAVFANCARPSGQPPSVPTMLSADAPPMAQADRAYQIAAAYFYAGQFAEAEAAFTAIARDSTSPWRTMAPYLAARAIVRQATMGGPKAAGNPAAFGRAMTAVNTILQDSTREDAYEPTRRLRQFIITRTRPNDVLLEVTASLSSSAQADGFAEHLSDFEYLLNRMDPPPDSFASLSPGNEAADLLDWVTAMQSGADVGVPLAIERWQHSHSMPWLVAAMAHLPSGHPRQGELMSAALAVDPGAPAYPTLAFHIARLRLREGRTAEARGQLDRAMATPGLPVSAMNLFKAARLQTATSLDDFLADAARVSIGDLDTDRNFVASRHTTVDHVLDRDVIDVLNERMPVAMLRRVASSQALPPSARQALNLSVFTRALLVEQWAVAREMLPEVARIAPWLAEATQPLRTTDDRRLQDEAALLLLRAPGLRPYIPAWSFRDAWSDYRKADGLTDLNGLRDNWWCSFRPADAGEVGYYYTPMLKRGAERVSKQQAGLYANPLTVPAPVFLTEADRQAAAEEWAALARIDTGPNELGRRVLDWARRNSADPRVPEMLHRVVRATRVGCTTDATGAISKAAFELLHGRYPKSPWAARTPHWFK